MLAMAVLWLAVGKGRHMYIPIKKMASGVQDITCVFEEVMKKTLILQCPGMVCSPPVVSKCLGEAHRRLDIIYITLLTLHYITLILFLFFILLVTRATDEQYGIRTFEDNSKLHGHTNEHVQFEGAHQENNRSLLPCRHTDNDMHRYPGHASMFLLTLHRTITVCG